MNNREAQSLFRRWRPILILVVAAAIGWWIYRTGPVTQPEEEKRPPKIVKTMVVEPSTHRIQVTAHGAVISARRVSIEPQVTGHVIRQHPALIPGGYLKEGVELYAIDSKLTELDLQENKAEIERAKAKLEEDRRKLNEGQRLSTEELIPTTELASLESVARMQESELQRLEARLARNQELLERHSVRAPFNAIVLDEAVELGQRVSPGDATVTLIGTDEFWVRASLPTDQLRWIRLPTENEPGARAEILSDDGNDQFARYSGDVIQRLSDLTEVGRMARILIRVKDPLRLEPAGGNESPLLLGSYVRVEIDAGELRNVMGIDRSALREGDRIWVVDGQNRLQIREVTVQWRQDETVYVTADIKPGESLIVSNLRVALPDMEVRSQPAVEASGSDFGAAAIQP